MTSIDELLEQDAPKGCEGVQDLYYWSTNFEAGRGPFALYLDLIGWTENEFGEGETVYDYAHRSLGYVELSKLARALEEYANQPHDVYQYVEMLMQAEMGDDE